MKHRRGYRQREKTSRATTQSHVRNGNLYFQRRHSETRQVICQKEGTGELYHATERSEGTFTDCAIVPIGQETSELVLDSYRRQDREVHYKVNSTFLVVRVRPWARWSRTIFRWGYLNDIRVTPVKGGHNEFAINSTDLKQNPSSLDILRSQDWFQTISERSRPLAGHGDISHIVKRPRPKKTNEFKTMTTRPKRETVVTKAKVIVGSVSPGFLEENYE